MTPDFQGQPVGNSRFEFDYTRNVIHFSGQVILLSPHEADILRVLLNNRAHPTSTSLMIQRVYGANEPEAAATSIRVAIHSLRKKMKATGVVIRSRPKLGYEIDTSAVPELNRRLSDRILLALNQARANGDHQVIRLLQQALTLADSRRGTWSSMSRSEIEAASAAGKPPRR